MTFPYSKLLSILIALSSAFIPISISGQTLYGGNGTISFVSNAPLETIKAASDKLSGIISYEQNNFAFSFPVKSFEGFNSPLQKEHFNEHYLETAQYPKSTFTGKIIGLDICGLDCEIQVFAKGKLEIHGITKIVTIPVEFRKIGNKIEAKSIFQLDLSDYNINIPKILEAKISPIIDVTVDVEFEVKQ